jgi:hypothetical protein
VLAKSGARVESNRLGQTGLPLIEGPKTLGLQLQSASYVERVKSADAESWAVSAGKIGAGFPGAMGKLYSGPQA